MYDDDEELDDYEEDSGDTAQCQFCGETFYPAFPGESVCPDCVDGMTEDS